MRSLEFGAFIFVCSDACSDCDGDFECAFVFPSSDFAAFAFISIVSNANMFLPLCQCFAVCVFIYSMKLLFQKSDIYFILYFRNALVRANYNDLKKGIRETDCRRIVMAGKRIKNRVQGTFIILFLLITISCNPCTNTVIEELNLPDASYKIIIFQRDCGATTSASLQLSIIPQTEKLPKDSTGNICITDGSKLMCDIVSDDTILIKYTGRLFLAKDNYGKLKIIYEAYW